MDTEAELPNFSGICRLFPLPNVVLFPHVILPLHVFEPRYRQMTEDALEGDQLVTIVQMSPRDDDGVGDEPVPIADVGCVGRIIQHDRMDDGRFDLLLLGCKRVRLVREVASPKLYRVAEAVVLEDEDASDSPDARCGDLITLFIEVLRTRHRLDVGLARLLQADLSPRILSDIIAHALDLPAPLKQQFLEETRVSRRVSRLIAMLREMIAESPLPRFPRQPFSLN